MESRLLSISYKLGAIRLVRSSISEAILGLSATHTQAIDDRRKAALDLGIRFCEAFLLGAEAKRVKPKNMKNVPWKDMDSETLRIYATILEAFEEKDFKEYEETVKRIKKILETIKNNDVVDHEEKITAIRKLNELYNKFRDKMSDKERQLLMTRL